MPSSQDVLPSPEDRLGLKEKPARLRTSPTNYCLQLLSTHCRQPNIPLLTAKHSYSLHCTLNAQQPSYGFRDERQGQQNQYI